MKSARRIALTIGSLAVATTLTAGPAQYFSSTSSAVESNRRVRVIQKTLVRDGYTLQSVQERPIMYFVAPEGDHAWGSVVYTYSRSMGGYSLQVDYVEVTVDLRCDLQGFYVSGIHTYEHSVY